MSENKPSVFAARVISLGRITIPEELRLLWQIVEGAIIELKIVSVQEKPKQQDQGGFLMSEEYGSSLTYKREQQKRDSDDLEVLHQKVNNLETFVTNVEKNVSRISRIADILLKKNGGLTEEEQAEVEA